VEDTVSAVERSVEWANSLTIAFEFQLLKDAIAERASLDEEASVIEDARGEVSELQGMLNGVLAAQTKIEERPRVISVAIEQGTIIVTIEMIVLGVMGGLALYGSARSGLDQLISDLAAACQMFFSRFGPYHLHLSSTHTTYASHAHTPVQSPQPGTVVSPPNQTLVLYLIISHAALLITLVAAVIVLLVRA
jgi:hypothetical protein